MPGFLRKIVIFLAFVFCVIFAAPGAYAACCDAGYYGSGKSCTACPAPFNNSDNVGKTCPNTTINSCYLTLSSGYYYNGKSGAVEVCPTGYTCPGGATVYYGEAGQIGRTANCNQIVRYKNPPAGVAGSVTPTLYKKTGSTSWYSDNTCTTQQTTPTNIPTYSGYICTGFYTAESGGTRVIDLNGNLLSWSVSQPTYIYAQWVTPIVTVSLNNQSATTAGSTAVYERYNTGIYLDAAATSQQMTTSTNHITLPTRTGYTFGGYYTGTNGTGTQLINASGYITNNFTTTRFTADTTIYAKWTSKVLTVTLDDNYYATSSTQTGEGVRDGVEPTTIYLKYNTGWYSNSGATTAFSSLTNIPNYNSTHPFYGFYTGKAGTGTKVIDENGNIISGNLTVCSQNCTLYAYYPQAYTVTFKTGNTTLGTQIFLNGESKALTAVSNFTQPVSSTYGWVFYGWRTNYGSNTRTYTDGQSITPTANMTLYGIWRRPVQFKRLSSATTTSFSYNTYYQYYYNTAANTAGVNSVTPTSLVAQTTYNWDPIGWVLNNTTSTTPTISQLAGATPVAITPAKDVVTSPYYALYNRQVTLVYNGNTNTGGTTENTIDKQYLNAGHSVAIDLPMILGPNGFTKDGYSFNKWAAGSTSGTQYSDGGTFNFPNKAVASSNTYNMYATWNQNCNAITFDNTTNNSGATPTSSVLYKLSEDTAWYDNNTCSGTPVTTLTTIPTIANGRLYGVFWSANSQGTVIVAPTAVVTQTYELNPNLPVSAPHTVYAHYVCDAGYTFNSTTKLCAPNTITLDWNENGGNAINSGSCTYGGNLTLPSAPNRTGYTFVGWKTAANETSGNYRAAGSTITGGCTSTYTGVTSGTSTAIQAQWTPNTITLDWNENGGGAIANGSCDNDGDLTLPAAPTRTGYTFTKWKLADGTLKDASATVTNGCTSTYTGVTSGTSTAIQAQWTPNCNAITLDNTTRGGTTANTTLYKYTNDPLWYSSKTTATTCATAVTTTAAPSKTNATFTGYYTSATNTTTNVGSNASPSVLNTTWTVNAPTTIYAHYNCGEYYDDGGLDIAGACNPDQCQITLNNADATTNGTTTLYTTYGVGVYLDSARTQSMTTSSNPITTPSRVGYSFDGYFGLAKARPQYILSSGLLNSNGYNAATSGSYCSTWDTGWTPNTIALDWDENGGGAITDGSCDYDGDLTLPSAPTRTGYTFAGWKLANNTTQSAGTTVTGGCTSTYTGVSSGTSTAIQAQWTTKVIEVTLDSDRWTSASSHGTVPTNAAPTPIYLKYNTGWYTNSAATTAFTQLTTLPSHGGYDFQGFYTEKLLGQGSQIIDANGNIISGNLTACSANCTLYAHYTLKEKLITLDGNGGTLGTQYLYSRYSDDVWLDSTRTTYPMTAAESADGTCTNPLTPPTKTGYTFVKFSGFNDIGEYVYPNGCLTSTGRTRAIWTGGDTDTWKAQWEPQTSTVTLNSNGGIAGSVTSVTATYDAAMPTISGNGALPTRPGYTFDGYGDTTTGGIKYYNADGTSARTWDKAGNQILYAIWIANCNAVTINVAANGGTINGDSESLVLYKHSGSGTHWVTHENCHDRNRITSLTQFGDGGLPEKTNASYTGVFENQGIPTGAQPIAIDGTLDDSWEISGPTTIYAHYNCDANYQGSGTDISGVCEPVVYTVNLDAKYYTSASASSGTNPTTAVAPTAIYQKYNTGWYTTSAATTAFSALTTKPAYSTYIFEGFWTGKTGTGTKVINADGTLVSGVSTTLFSATGTLYAKWTQTTCSVTNGTGTPTTPSNNAPRCTVTCNNGYSTSGTYTGTGTTVTYACTGNNITLDWDENGGGSISNGSCTYGGNLALPAAPSRTGYTFTKWKLADGTLKDASSTVTGGCTSTYTGVTSGTSTSIQAQWTPNVYTVNLDAKYYTSASASSGTNPDTAVAPTAIYQKYNTGWYTTSAATTAFSALTTKPAYSTYIFEGFYTGKTGTGTKVINADGTLVSDVSTTLFTATGTLYAKWTLCSCTNGTGATGCAATVSNNQCNYTWSCSDGYYKANQSANNGGNSYTATCTACPTNYPNSVNSATAITQCYSGTKSRAWTGSQTACALPTNCYGKTCNTCSNPACDYVAYSNSTGNGDGTVKSGCETNNAACQQTVASVTALAGAYVAADGISCSVCTSGYQATNGSTATSCTACTTGYSATTSGITNHDAENDCKATITLNKNGGSGTILSATGTTAATKECSQGTACSFPDASGLTQTGYTFATTWSTSDGVGASGCVSSATNPTGTYYACKTANTNTAYKVYHYTKNVGTTTYTQNGNVDNLSGTTGATLTLANLARTISGFTYSEGFAGTAATGTTKPTSGAVTTTTILADGTRVISLYYTRNTYTVTLTSGTGISATTGGGSYEHGASVTINATVADGNTWTNWTQTTGGTQVTTTKNYTFTMPMAAVAYTANASANNYTITLDNANATTNGTATLYTTHDTDVYLDSARTHVMTTSAYPITIPQRSGYTFEGYNCPQGNSQFPIQCIDENGNLTTQGRTNGISYTDNTTVWNASWRPNVYEVTLNKNANNATAGSASVFEYFGINWYNKNPFAQGSGTTTITSVPTLPTRTNYTFRGFYSDANIADVDSTGNTGTQMITQAGVLPANNTFDANTTLYAGWARNCAATSPATCTLTVADNGAVTYETSCPDNVGYTLVNSGKYNPSCTAATSTVTLDKNANDAVAGTQSVTAIYGSAMPTPVTSPTRQGYEFIGYFDTANATGGTQYYSGYNGSGSGNILSSRSWDKVGNHTLYARWKAKCNTISFDGDTNGGSSLAGKVLYKLTDDTVWYKSSKCAGTAYTTLRDAEIELPTKSNATFTGFFENSGIPTGTKVVDDELTLGALSDTWTVNSNRTIYAHYDCDELWQGNGVDISGGCALSVYNINYVMNGGTNYAGAPTTYTYGTGATIDGTPTRANSIFKAWCEDAGLTENYCANPRIISTTDHGDKTYYAWWICNDGYHENNDGSACVANTIILDWNEDGGSAVTNGSCTYDGDLTLPAASTRTGYTFVGWILYDGTTKLASTTVTNGCTKANTGVYSGTSTAIKARWEKNTYTIAYAGMDGATHGSSHPTSATYDAEFTVNAPSKTGYTFTGWNISGMDTTTHYHGTSSANTSFSTATLNGTTSMKFKNLRATSGTVTFTAQWTAQTSTVTLDKNANDAVAGTQSVTATYDSAMPAITGSGSLPTRTGYTFAGYYDTSAASGGTKYYNADGTSAHTWDKTGAQTLWARWTANIYNVTYTCGNGTGTAPTSPATATYDASYTPAANTCTKTGYSFAGWLVERTGDVKAASVAFTWNYTEDVTFVAQWTAQTSTVTLNPNGGSGGTTSVTATYDAAMPTPITLPTRPGYAFTGYYDATSGGTQYYTVAGASARTWNKTGAQTLYARWESIKYRVDYDLDGGTSGGSQPTSVNYDVEFTVSYPTKAGYAFAGWNISNMDTTTHYHGTTSANTAFSTTTLNGTTSTKFKNLTTSYETTGVVHFVATWTAMDISAPNKTLTYNGTSTTNGTAQSCANVTVTSPSGATVTYSTTQNGTYTGTAPTLTTVSQSPITVWYKVSASGYTDYIGSYTCTMNAATSVYTKENKTKVYDGTALTCNGVNFSGSGNKPTDGTIKYSTTQNGTYTTTVPEITNVGSQTVWFKVSGTNFTESAADSFTCSVTAAPGTTIIKEGNNVVTSGSVQYPNIKTLTAVCSESATISSVTSATTGVATASNSGNTITLTPAGTMGTSVITVNCPATTNYTASSATYTLTVGKGDCTLTLSATSGSTAYGTNKTFTVTSSPTGGSLSVVSGTTSVATAAISNGTVTMTPVAQGSSTITVTRAETSQYNSCSANYNLTVTRANCQITLTPNSDSVTYPTTTSTFSIDKGSCNGAISSALSNNTSSATFALSNNNTTGTVTYGTAGSVTVTITAAQTNQYNAATATFTGTANNKVIVLKKNGGSGTCGGAAGTNDGTVTCTYGGTCTAPAWNSTTCNIANADKVFTGWNTAADGNGTAYASGADLTNATSPLYAQWATPTCVAGTGVGTTSLNSVSGNAPVCNKTASNGNYCTSATQTGTAGALSLTVTCTACPALDTGYAYVSGTGWTSYSQCKETKGGTNCSGALTKTANSATTWGSVVSTLTAAAGSYVNGERCDLCATGSYTATAGSQTSCTMCTNGTTTSGTGQTSCNATCVNNNDYDYAWATPAWNNNSPTNVCAVASCKKGSHLSTDANLPSGYTQLAYLQNSGTQYINTGFVPSADFKHTLVFEVLSSANSNRYVCGTGVAQGRSGNVRVNGNTINGIYIHNGSGSGAARSILDATKTLSGITTLVLDLHNNAQNTALLNSVNVANTTTGTITSTSQLQLFAMNSSYVTTGVRIYNSVIEQNGEIIHNFVPAKNSSGVLGMYDTVSGAFKTNAGSGTFVAGPVTSYANSCEECVGATYQATDGSVATACTACPNYYTYNTDNGKTAASQCQIECAGGSYVAAANDASCSNVGTAYWSAGEIVNYGSVGTRTACPTGLTTTGSGVGADEAGDCGRILHVGAYSVRLRSAQKTTPSLKFDTNNDGEADLFGSMTTTQTNMSSISNKKLKVNRGGTVYYVHDDTATAQ